MPKQSRPSVIPGSIHAIPISRGGHVPIVVTRVPTVQTQERTVFVYVDGTHRSTPEQCADVGPAHTWSQSWLGFCTSKPFELGRWPRVGSIERFEPSAWPVPPSRHSKNLQGWRSTELYADDGTMRLVANLAEPWPAARLDLIQQASAFEKFLAHHASGREPGAWDLKTEFTSFRKSDMDDWIGARAATDTLAQAHPVPPPCTRQVEEGDLISVPLDCGGFGVVLAAIVEPKARGCQFVTMLGLPIFTDWPADPRACQHVRPEDMVSIWNSESIGVRYGDWTVIGKLESFSRELYCVPFYTEFFLPKGTDPVIASTHRWAGRALRIKSPDRIPRHFLPELQRHTVTTFTGGVREDLSNYRQGTRTRQIAGHDQYLTPDHARLWREMASWAAKEADRQA